MKPFYATVRFIVRTYLRIFYRMKTYGLENGHHRAVILAPNHTSFFDPCIVSCTWPEEIHFFARKTLFKNPIFGTLIRKLNTHPVSPGAANLETVKSIARYLGEGKEIILFPEGERSYDGSLGKGQLGVAMFSMHANCPIIPIYIHGAFKAFPRARRFPKLWGKLACVYGAPIHPKDFAHLDKKKARAAITEKLMEEIANLKEWYITEHAQK